MAGKRFQCSGRIDVQGMGVWGVAMIVPAAGRRRPGKTPDPDVVGRRHGAACPAPCDVVPHGGLRVRRQVLDLQTRAPSYGTFRRNLHYAD